MIQSIRIEPEAEADIATAYSWYERQRPGLGHEFLLAIEAVMAAIHRNAEAYPTTHGEVRRAIMRRFPFGVFFVIDRRIARVIAVMHAKRNPQVWKRRRRR